LNWNSQRVLVTGAGGFIGSHLSERLVKEGAEVRALVHYNALGTHGWLDHSPLHDDMEIFAGDICDRDSVHLAMKNRDIVFHLAALIAIPYSYRVPFSFVRVNIEGTLNALNVARELDIERLIHTSTSEVYGTARYVPIDEEHPLQGQSPYSASKIGADKMAEAFHLSFGLPVVILRPFNTFGPRQSDRAVIPTIITQCLHGKSVHLGSLSPTRDLNYVSNTIDGYLLAAGAANVEGQVINLGSGKEISIGELAKLIAELTGVSVEIISEEQRARPDRSEVHRLLADNDRAWELLGWKPAVSLRDGLKSTITWIRNNFDRYRPDVYTI